MPRKVKCSYREGSRRCPFNGEGNPPLCGAHQVAVQEAARPRSATEVIAEAAFNFLSGKPINREATIGAFDAFINQWASGLGADWRPDVNVGQSEDSAHRQGRAGGWRGQGRDRAPPPEVPPEIQSVARQVLGFGPREKLDAALINARRKELARKYHPDRAAGDTVRAKALTEQMMRVNQSADLLITSLQQAQQRRR